MNARSPLTRLEKLSRRFGPTAAREKLPLLTALRLDSLRSREELTRLQSVLQFMAAYPDDPRIRSQVDRIGRKLRTELAKRPRRTHLENSGLPASDCRYAYSHEVLRRLVGPRDRNWQALWDDLEDESHLTAALSLVILASEAEAFEESSLGEWLASTSPGEQTRLYNLLAMLEAAPLAPALRVQLYEASSLPILYHLGPGHARLEVRLPTPRVAFQKQELDRSPFPLAPRIRAPLTVGPPLNRAEGRRLVRTCLLALCNRNLEIHSLIYGNPSDTRLVDCGSGLQIALIGTEPAFRSALESLYAFVVFRNGVPLAYGPAGILFGCCEMGVNLFPEFRGGEIRSIYAQLMRVLRHAFGVELYFLRPYGMGIDNEDAIESGAFWFYRKLGFVPSNPEVERIARSEERRMARDPGHRSSTRTLRRLAPTFAYLDLSNGARRPLDLVSLASAVSRRLAGQRHTVEATTRRQARRIGLEAGRPAEARTLRDLAPILEMVDGRGFDDKRKAEVRAFIRAKASPSEAGAARRLSRMSWLSDALVASGIETLF